MRCVRSAAVAGILMLGAACQSAHHQLEFDLEVTPGSVSTVAGRTNPLPRDRASDCPCDAAAETLVMDGAEPEAIGGSPKDLPRESASSAGSRPTVALRTVSPCWDGRCDELPWQLRDQRPVRNPHLAIHEARWLVASRTARPGNCDLRTGNC